MDSYLQSEIKSLLEELERQMGKRGTSPNLALRARIVGTNPFLIFYLRDVPPGRVDEFRLSVSEERHGHAASVTVGANAVFVAARSPSVLVDTASRYLASPSLA